MRVLSVVIEGAALPGGGVQMDRGTVSLGTAGAPDLYRGEVTSLDGTRYRRGPRDSQAGQPDHPRYAIQRQRQRGERLGFGSSREGPMTADPRMIDASAPAANAPRGARLLPPRPTRSLDEHIEWYGEMPETGPGALAEVERSGLRGKGGARFPTATKLAAVASRRRAIVVANGTEGEPASLKDTVLMTHAPHLVLDGAERAAEIVGARDVVVCVKRGSVAIPVLERAIAERRAYGYDRRLHARGRRSDPLRVGRGDVARHLAERRRREAGVRSAPSVRARGRRPADARAERRDALRPRADRAVSAPTGSAPRAPATIRERRW